MGKKETIIEHAKGLAVDGKLNMTMLRKEYRSFYMKIASVFDSVDDFKNMMKPIECYHERYGVAPVRNIDTYSPQINAVSLRNKIAYEKLMELRTHYTFEEIAEKYNVSRQAIHSLVESLKKVFRDNIDEGNKQNYNQNTL